MSLGVQIQLPVGSSYYLLPSYYLFSVTYFLPLFTLGKKHHKRKWCQPGVSYQERYRVNTQYLLNHARPLNLRICVVAITLIRDLMVSHWISLMLRSEGFKHLALRCCNTA